MRKKITSKIVFIIQFLIIYPALVLLYIIGFGVTMILTRVFHPSLYKKKKKNLNTYWEEPEECQDILEEI